METDLEPDGKGDGASRVEVALWARCVVQCAGAGHLPADLDADRAASLLVVLIMGLAHLETLAPGRIGDEAWIRFLESAVADFLTWNNSNG